MHNGIFKNLDEVIDFFNKGGGEGNKVLKLKTFLVEALSGENLRIKTSDIP